MWLVSFDDPYVGEPDPENPVAWGAVAMKLPPNVQIPDQCVYVAYRVSAIERRIFIDGISTLPWPV